MLTLWIGVQWYLFVVLICISLMINYGQPLSVLICIHVSSLVICVQINLLFYWLVVSYHLLLRVFIYSVVHCESIPHTPSVCKMFVQIHFACASGFFSPFIKNTVIALLNCFDQRVLAIITWVSFWLSILSQYSIYLFSHHTTVF